MTAADQVRQALAVHVERCQVCTEGRACPVAAGVAHDLNRALEEEKRQITLAITSPAYVNGYDRLRRARIEAYREAKRKGIL